MTAAPPDLDGRLRKVGLGYELDDRIAGVQFAVSHLDRRYDGLHGELSLHRRTPGPTGPRWERLYAGRFNLSSSSDREAKARYACKLDPQVRTGLMDAKDGAAWWLALLAHFAEDVISAERKGDPVQEVICDTEDYDDGPVMLLDPLIWVNQPTMIYGPGKAGKTTIGAAIAVTVETGHMVVPGWRCDLTAPVLVLDWETDLATYKALYRAICRGAGVASPKLRYLRMRQPLEVALETVAAYVSDHAIGLVIIDSSEPASSGDDWTRRADGLYNCVRDLDSAALLLDHVPGSDLNGDHGPSLKPIGGVRKRDRARATFELRGQADQLTIRDGGGNLRAPLPTMELAIYRDLDSRGRATAIRFRRQQVTDPALQQVALTPTERIMRNLDHLITPADLSERTGIAQNNLRARLSQLQAEGRVQKVGSMWGKAL